MAEKRRRRRQDEDADPPTKEEYAVAKYLRFNSDTKEGKLVGMSVQCFIASKAVDALMESKWSAAKSDSDILFGTRHSCVTYCDRLLQKGLFHRAARVEKKKGDKTKKKKKLKDGEEPDPTDEEKEKKSKKDAKDKKSKKEKEEAEKSEESEKKLSEKEDKKEDEKDKDKEKKKKEKKLKLVMHDEQLFKDGDEVYVWIYDPVPLKTFVIGLLLVLGAIGLCLFPLWPSEVRVGVYYLSLSGAVFVGFILFLIVLRFILFCAVWLLTLGKHHFWFLPNLSEDVGFFDSFRPLYKHDRFDGNKIDKTNSKTKKGKGSDEGDKEIKSDKVTDKPSEKSVENVTEDNKDEQNGFELVEKEDVDEMDESREQEEGEEESGEDGQLEESENEDQAEEEETEPKKTK